MKKLDKFLFISFLPPFLVSYLTACFILVMQFMLKYFDEFVGKGISFHIFMELFFYFSVSLTPNALPLALLLSSLICFGNLAEYSENTAIKAAGVSPRRILKPLLIFVGLLSVGSYSFIDRVVPTFNIKAYSLLYDIRMKKPTFNLISGEFYTGLPGFSIRAAEEMSDGTLKDVIIYDHTNHTGKYDVILADFCSLTHPSVNCMVMTLHKGSYYTARNITNKRAHQESMTKIYFDSMQFAFDMSDFSFSRSQKALFSRHRYTVPSTILKEKKESLDWTLYVERKRVASEKNSHGYQPYARKNTYLQPSRAEKDPSYSRNKVITMPLSSMGVHREPVTQKESLLSFFARLRQKPSRTQRDNEVTKEAVSLGLPTAYQRQIVVSEHRADTAKRLKIKSLQSAIYSTQKKRNAYEIEIHRRYALSVACFLMFLIGGSIGTIVKKGGIGVPVLIAFVCYVSFYSLLILGEKNAKEGAIAPAFGAWMADMWLFLIGLFFVSLSMTDNNILSKETLWRLHQPIKRWSTRYWQRWKSSR